MRSNFSVSQKSTCRLTNELGKVSGNGKWKSYLRDFGVSGLGGYHLVCQSNKLLTDRRGEAKNPAKRIRAASIFSSCPGRRWRPNNHQHHHPIEKLWKIVAPKNRKSRTLKWPWNIKTLTKWRRESEGGGNECLAEAKDGKLTNLSMSLIFFW